MEMPTYVGIFIIYKLRKFHTQPAKQKKYVAYLLAGKNSCSAELSMNFFITSGLGKLENIKE